MADRPTVAAQLAVVIEVVRRLEERLEHDYKERQDVAMLAAESREAITERLTRIEQSLINQDTNLKHIDNRVGKMEPIVEKFLSWQSLATGAFFVIGAIGSVILAVLTLMREKILTWLGA